ncbi:Opioid-binding protein/cell adhesion molecule-like protein [Frankliniella fusca]|uniref:Opioid-binding protein/cell adhesion molecule-like protein n=1 Tax=Frankliniella fusca TaxID=407009 RepID=A0AAE1LJ59_9NEOP|nr:Opioid-binding protein/cell adhesion molecule-like protein [Frankliniella fusca]
MDTTAMTRVLVYLAVLAGLLLCRCHALRDMLLVMPPVARAGSSVTLRCLYDLEADKLYAIKWYRGSFEFYRAMPKEVPAKQAFPYPDIHVDLSQSDEHQVTLRRVPLHMSGTFACEVTTDGPPHTTLIKKGQLLVLDTVRRPVLTVSKNVYRPGDELEANCTSPSPSSVEPLPLGQGQPGPARGKARFHSLPPPGAGGLSLLPEQPPLQPHQLTAEQRRHLEKEAASEPVSFGFWVNNRPVPAAMVQQAASSATLRRPITEEDFSPNGELRLKCVATVADKYREPSHVVTVRRQEEDEEEYEDEDDGVEEPPAVVGETPPVHTAVDSDSQHPAGSLDLTASSLYLRRF